jgi:putative transposase
MARRRSYTPEQIITELRKAEIYHGQGKTVKKASRMLEISEQTCFRRRRDYGGMDISQVKKLKEMEKENVRLKKMVDELSLDNAILKEVLGKR